MTAVCVAIVLSAAQQIECSMAAEVDDALILRPDFLRQLIQLRENPLPCRLVVGEQGDGCFAQIGEEPLLEKLDLERTVSGAEIFSQLNYEQIASNIANATASLGGLENKL